MNSFQKKALAAAVFAGLGSGAAMAAHVNPAGLGQYLIFPYYTVQQSGGNAYNTIVTVVNTTTLGKVVKVRFREGKNSREVLDFNLYLSPNDVWVGVLSSADATTSSPARLTTPDTSCTNPRIPATGVDFRNFLLGEASDFVTDKSMARTREGYLEMIESATVYGDTLLAITHDATGVPADCDAVNPVPAANLLTDFDVPTGGLSGTGNLINVNNGTDMAYKPVAISNAFFLPIAPTLGSESVRATDLDPWSVRLVGTSDNPTGQEGDQVYMDDWFLTTPFPGVNAMSALMMSTQVMNEFVIETGTKSATDWVLTFPTKRFYYASASPFTASTPFTAAGTTAGACETISFEYVNREERGAAAGGEDFSPPPPAGPASTLCWEANVVSLRGDSSSGASLVLGSQNVRDIAITTGAQNGWGKLTFTGANATGVGLTSNATSDAYNWSTLGTQINVPKRFLGLPVTGFMLRTFNNGTLSCGTGTCISNFGSALDHSYRVSISPSP